MSRQGRLLVASNRLPITIQSVEDSKRLCPTSGGLVSALIPILRESRGCWIGWTGIDYDETVAELVRNWGTEQSYSFIPIFLTAAERACHYRGFSNEIIWPLFHGLPSRCLFDSRYWNAYQKVNLRFAAAVEGVSQPDDIVWVHDYHLMMCAQALRSRGLNGRVVYFHHIPFPSPDVFAILPWRIEILRGLMQFDTLGFQTTRDRHNFIACLKRFLPGVRISRIGETFLVRAENRCAIVGAFPISVDYEAFALDASGPTVVGAAEAIQNGLGPVRIILGIDRLDYTKGIPERLNAFQALLKQNPQLRGQVTLLQIVVPSREDIPEYVQLRFAIETRISRINGEYGSPGWMPIHYLYRSVSRTELIAFYRAADVALVTPLKDGMNLIAKEFCASRVDGLGVLVLSEFAGAAEEMKCGALLVNPYDADTMAAVLEAALRMDEQEQRARMQNMRSQIREHNVFDWSRSFSDEDSIPAAAVAAVDTSSAPCAAA